MLGDLMANHVWTRMTINSDDLSVHEHIGEWFTPDMPSWDKEAVRNAVEPIFGAVSYTHLTLPTICSV